MYSVVILSRDANNLIPCVAAIIANEPNIDPKQIIVVDDGASVGCLPALRGLNWVGGEKPFIFSRNANIGLRKAFESSDAACLFNDDALLRRREGFTSLYGAWQKAPTYGLLASSCNNVGNENQLPRGSEFIRRENRMLCFVCVLIPKSIFEEVGPMDEDFTGYGWDDDSYSLMVKRAGYRLGIWDGCFVDHEQLHSTFRGDGLPHEAFMHNKRIFEQKYGGHEA